MEEYDYKSSDDNESSHECNIIFQDKAESDDDEASLPGLMVRDNIKESDYESDDEFYMPGLTRRAADNNGSSNSDAACLFYKNMVLTNSRPNNKKARASVIFTLEDKHGIRKKYLGLLDTESTGGLISKELVDKYDFKIKKTTACGTQMQVILRRKQNRQQQAYNFRNSPTKGCSIIHLCM